MSASQWVVLACIVASAIAVGVSLSATFATRGCTP
jgi:hypothetical protein